jgi:hypothetical protein
MTRNKDRRVLRGAAAAVTVCALVAPTASAVPAEQFLPSQSAGSSSSEPANVRVVKVAADGRFDWGDAGIGATAALAVAAIGAGAAFTFGRVPRRRHAPQPIR